MPITRVDIKNPTTIEVGLVLFMSEKESETCVTC